MDVIRGLDNIPQSLRGCVITIGNFDGVHRGHQQLIAQAKMCAVETNGAVVVASFDPHPLAIVAPQRAPALLMPLEVRARCMQQAGASALIILESERGLLGMEPEQFVADVIVKHLAPTHIVEGESFGFGRARQGTVADLDRWGGKYGYQTLIVPPVKLRLADQQISLVSSSLIRQLLTSGRVNEAALCLGRPYCLFGTVGQGAGRGRGLGYPTANLQDIEQLIPADGVYAGWASVDERRSLTAISIGHNPTFDGQLRKLEAHLLDSDDIRYGQSMAVEFGSFVRAQRRFDSADELRRQIALDVEAIRRFVSSENDG